MPLKDMELLSGEYVRIPYTEDLLPPEHGAAFQKQWKPDSGRETLAFYDSTVEYMRNEWAEAHARSTEVTLGDKSVLLFFDERTRTWNSPEALDVDHITPWREHLADKEVWSREDAMLAYNDAGNLRTVPSNYNRARNAADAILDEHGADSPEWRDWITKKVHFDASKDYPAYDPDVDAVTRNRTTSEAEWTPGMTRKGLGFDDPIKTIWMDHALKEAYAGEVKVPDPDHPDDRTKDHAVQLFRCSATDQLLTRGGLDVDHEVPFAIALQKMLDMNTEARELAATNGDEPPPPISKADVMDLYNNPENLRLMSRSANSAHEWEVGVDGQLYDPELDGVEYATEEPTVAVDDDDVPIVYADDDVNPKKRLHGDALPPGDPLLADGDSLESDTKRTKRAEGDDQVLSRHDAAILAMHPDDFRLLDKMKGEVAKLDPAATGPLSLAQQENLSMVLVHGARGNGIDIDHVVFNPSTRMLFGVQGPVDNDTGKTFFPLDGFKNVPLEVSADHVANLRQQQAMQAQPVQPPPTPTHTL